MNSVRIPLLFAAISVALALLGTASPAHAAAPRLLNTGPSGFSVETSYDEPDVDWEDEEAPDEGRRLRKRGKVQLGIGIPLTAASTLMIPGIAIFATVSPDDAFGLGNIAISFGALLVGVGAACLVMAVVLIVSGATHLAKARKLASVDPALRYAPLKRTRTALRFRFAPPARRLR